MRIAFFLILEPIFQNENALKVLDYSKNQMQLSTDFCLNYGNKLISILNEMSAKIELIDISQNLNFNQLFKRLALSHKKLMLLLKKVNILCFKENFKLNAKFMQKLAELHEDIKIIYQKQLEERLKSHLAGISF